MPRQDRIGARHRGEHEEGGAGGIGDEDVATTRAAIRTTAAPRTRLAAAGRRGGRARRRRGCGHGPQARQVVTRAHPDRDARERNPAEHPAGQDAGDGDGRKGDEPAGQVGAAGDRPRHEPSRTARDAVERDRPGGRAAGDDRRHGEGGREARQGGRRAGGKDRHERARSDEGREHDEEAKGDPQLADREPGDRPGLAHVPRGHHSGVALPLRSSNAAVSELADPPQ